MKSIKCICGMVSILLIGFSAHAASNGGDTTMTFYMMWSSREL